MLLKLDSFLRKIVLIIGALCIIFKLTDNGTSHKQDKSEEFQTVEFDDIW